MLQVRRAPTPKTEARRQPRAWFRLARQHLHFLVPAGVAGLYGVLALRAAAARRLLCAALVPLTLFGVYAFWAFALVYQREFLISSGYYGPWSAAKAEEFRQWRRSIDAYFLNAPPAAATSGRSQDTPRVAVPGRIGTAAADVPGSGAGASGSERADQTPHLSPKRQRGNESRGTRAVWSARSNVLWTGRQWSGSGPLPPGGGSERRSFSRFEA